ncbi:YaaR family protein [Bacillota bacterium LX-D]|nr:YaaR family protein [Bacillota bacterium LX-D]
MRKETSTAIKSGEFSQQFQFSQQQERQKYLQQLFNKIKQKGKQIVNSNNIHDINQYKKLIKEYLSFILRSAYSVDPGIMSSQGRYLSVVKVVDEELAELGKLMLEKEKDTLALVQKISKIEGLLLDIYQ